MDTTGTLLGGYSNGVSTVLGHIAAAVFPAPQALRHRGDGLFQATAASGDAVIGPAGDTVRPRIVAGTLERLPTYACAAP